MADANPFDQFDTPAKPAANPFDQFDEQPRGQWTGGAPIMSGPAMDAYVANEPIGKVLDAFGQGAKQGWGTESLGLSPETEQFLKKTGIFNDYQSGQASLVKSFNEAIIRPAAAAADVANRTWGAAFAGGQAATQQAFTEAGAPILGQDIAAMPEAFLGSPLHIPAAAPGGLFERPAIAPEITKARSLGVIGEGEAGWAGTASTTPANDAARADAIKADVAQAPEPAPAAPPAEPATAPDIHQTARSIAPEVFTGPNGYDALSQRRDTFRRWIDDLQEKQQQDAEDGAPHTEEIADLKSRMEDATPRLAKKYQARLDELEPANEAAISDALSQESPDIARVRAELQKVDYAMRDLAPQVSEAYRQAQEFHPAPEEAAEAPAEATEQPAAEPAAAEAQQPEAAPAAPEPAATIAPGEQAAESSTAARTPTVNIADDVAQKLVAAGRPADEAQAAAALVQAHYETRAARFGGAKGTAEDLYKSDAPDIRAGRVRSAPIREFAQRGEPVKTIKGDEIAGPEADVKTLRAAARKFYQEKLRGTAVHSDALGKDVEFRSADKSFNASANPNKLRLFAALPEIIQKGRLISSQSPRIPEIERSTKAYHYLEATVRIGDVDHIVGVTIREDANGHLYYNHSPIEEGRSRPSTTEVPPSKDGPGSAGGGAALNQKLVPQGGDVNMTLGKVESRQGATRGKIKLNEGRNVITLMKNADASTFIHETGHQWLEELVSDAADEKAPADLMKDAATVRDWLGVKEGESIPTKAHEKFARGFENYMMEGRAPSKALASVFAKFRDWLTKIYQTAAKLRSPISDDIRDVFDRLLSNNPEKQPVIAADREPAKAFADIHEEEAKSTSPEHAEAVGDNINAEIEKIALKEAPDIHDKLTDGQGGGVPTEDANPPGGADAAGPVAGEAGPAAKPGAIAAGGNNAVPESRAVSGQPGEGSGNPAGSDRTAEPVGPHDPFPGPASDLVDKAGNIRLDNLGTPEDVNAVIRETAQDNDDFMGARRGVLSDASVLDLADALGMDPALLNTRKIGQAYNAEQIIAARKLLIQSASSVRDAMIKAAEGSDAEVMAYAEAKSRHRMIQEQVAGITAEAGRALRAFRDLGKEGEEAKQIGDFLKDATGRTLNQLREEAQFGKNLRTLYQLSKFVNDTTTGKLRSAILEYYINALISGPFTHMRYSVGNAINALWTPLAEIPAAAAVGKLRELAGAETEGGVHLGEAGAQLYALMKGSRDGLSAAIESFKTGVSPALPGERVPPQFMEPKPGAIPGPIGQAIRIPGKGVAAIHSFFKTLRYEQNIQGLAYRAATEEGLAGEAFNARIAELTGSPTEDMMNSASADALKELYMAPTDYHSAMGALTRATNNNLAAKIIVPFMKIGSQITKNAFMERTPLGFADKEIRANLLGVNGEAARDMQVGKITTGVALMGATVLMAAEGMATGDGPADPAQRRVWLLNHTPNTIQIGNIRIPYQGLGHLGMLMRFSANMTETAQAWDGQDGGKLAIAGLEGISKSVLDENFMRGVKDMLDAVYHPQEYGPQYIRSFVTNWLPFSVGMSQTARAIDPYSREAHSILEAAQAKVPFASEGLFPRMDVFGQPIPSGGNPAYASDPVVKELESLHIGIGNIDKKIRGVTLTEQQFYDYSRVAGRYTKALLDQIVKSPGWQSIPAQMRIEAIHKSITGAREAAASQVMMQSSGGPNDIIKQAVAAKVAPLHGSP